jgi:glycosyltransferase involved in cell wall biosynthesis
VTFSVVIPTHGRRLDFLVEAVETVRRQNDPDFELVIFDNASSDDVAGFVSGLRDARVRYVRSNDFLPVTESWNRAISLATGDYVTFLGDDDGLAPGYFSALREIVGEFENPDVVYCGILQFLHPGVAPWERRGYVADVRNGFFFEGRRRPFRLSKEDATKAVLGSLRLRRNFTFNIQAFAFSRTFLARLGTAGPIFRSPFPDYYLANVAMLHAASVVVVPAPLSMAGVCKASFGYTLFNGLEAQGTELLNAKLAADPLYKEVEALLLPGPRYNTNYVVTMEHVARQAGNTLRAGVDFRRYRRLQILSKLGATRGRALKRDPAGQGLWARLGWSERAWASAVSLMLRAGKAVGRYRAVFARLQRLTSPYGYEPVVRRLEPGRFSRLMDIYDAMEHGGIEGLTSPTTRVHARADAQVAPLHSAAGTTTVGTQVTL